MPTSTKSRPTPRPSQPPTSISPSGTEMLTPSELERLKRESAEAGRYFKNLFSKSKSRDAEGNHGTKADGGKP